jgi:hypothetical protein
MSLSHDEAQELHHAIGAVLEGMTGDFAQYDRIYPADIERLERARELAAVIVHDQLMLDSAGPDPRGGFNARMHAGGPQTKEILLTIADAMRATLDEHAAPNYLEMGVRASDGKEYVMVLQRKGKLTPHEARQNAEAEAARLREELTK